MHNLSPHPRLVNSNQLLTTSTGNFYVYTSWRHILEIRFCISNKLPSNVNTAGARQGPYHRECKQREETLRTFQGCPYPTNGTKDAMYAEDVYKTQTPLPRKFNIIWKCTEHPLCQPTEASNYPREECWKQLELLTFFLVSSMHDRLLSSVWLKFINSPPQILMDRLQPPALFCLSFLSFCCLLSQATTTGEEIHGDHILLFKWAIYFQFVFLDLATDIQTMLT